MAEIRDLKKRILEDLRSQELSTCQAFCVEGCPIHQSNRSWLYLACEGKMEMALDYLLRFNPLPASTSRVCAKYCEKEANQFCGMACCRSINAVEKYLGDYARQHRYKRYRKIAAHKEKIAIMGAGPAGLTCAYQLWHAGFSPTIFERREKPGGIMYFGIPESKLPNEILLGEIYLHLEGIDIRTDVEINAQNFAQFEDYDAIVIATGHSTSKMLNIPGENLENVFGSIDFLSDINLQKSLNIRGKEILVIGGGETAIEVANAAIDFGAKAEIVYRKGRGNLGCPNEMVEALKLRGGEFEFHMIPREIQRTQTGRLEIKLEMFTGGKNGHPYFTLRQPDFIVIAIGQKPQFDPWPSIIQESIQRQDFKTLESMGVFVAGDLYHGQKSVAHAIASGNDTAAKIYNYFSKQ